MLSAQFPFPTHSHTYNTATRSLDISPAHATLTPPLCWQEPMVSKISFSKEEQDVLVRKIKLYFREELQQDIGQFDAQFLLTFFAEEIGPFFYNRGLYDAQALIAERMENITDALYELEKPTRS
ncbi:DUF2164 domain-containing protein [Pokkaliibacter sp. MBI-7]|uniref:DUF2164 domain-containing protein n=1 Tax=Pokkaliibacter sp. MBI-7 TaxID=3040600 RepID=UPI0032656A69